MGTGRLLISIHTASDALPINECDITVSDAEGKTVFAEHTVKEDSGLSGIIYLEAPDREISLNENASALPYSVFDVTVRAEGHYITRVCGVQVFDGILSDLPIGLIPLPDRALSPENANISVFDIPKHILTEEDTDTLFPLGGEEFLPAVNILTGVYIPETVTVHLGKPDEKAENVKVPFSDYIKNVASSEVYPTWPKEALEANIKAQISLTLNRIYTEWYRSRGYGFDITSSTAYDQAFIYGRNIFTRISEIVDSIFNIYITRPNRIEPLFASYCNGTTTTCVGMSQWGTVSLAESGKDDRQILEYYYGDIILKETDDIRTPTESYPGYILKRGDRGKNVTVIQEQLNRIAINYPLIPLNTVSGVFDEATENAVRTFQHIFVIPETGTADRATWYRISYVYTSVKRLSQITSEGQREFYNRQIYPGEILKRGSRGSEVQEMQFYLQRINIFNPAVAAPKVDGIFGSGTESAVISFQRAYGMAQTGIIDEKVWNAIVDVYNGSIGNTEEPSGEYKKYPGYIIKSGTRGEDVIYVQEHLNLIGKTFAIVPQNDADGVFGAKTKKQVIYFQAVFGLPQTGAVDEKTWEKINEIHATAEANCVFKSAGGAGTEKYPGYVVKRGARGEKVIYIQEKINAIYRALPYVGQLNTDGIFGGKTENSVMALQRIFGLTQTGRVDEVNWRLINYIYTAVTDGCIPEADISRVLGRNYKN